MKLTSELIDAATPASKSWTAAQMAYFGWSGCPQKGWKQQLVGREMSEEDYAGLVAAGSVLANSPENKRRTLERRNRVAGCFEPGQVIGGKNVEALATEALRQCMRELGHTSHCKMAWMVKRVVTEKVTKKNWRELLVKWFHEGCPRVAAARPNKPRIAKTSKLVRPGDVVCSKNAILPTQKQRTAKKPKQNATTYQDYLNGDLWNAIRRYVLLAASYECKVCGCPANQVHHTSYDRMTMRGRDISKLVALCRECHHGIEFDEAGEKMTLAQANERLDRMLSRELDREFLEITGV